MHATAAAPERLESRRETILRVAEDVFAERGYDRARLDDVAQRVGIRRASLLYHFKDKGALYGAVLDSIFEDLIEGYRRVLDGDGSAGERLEQTVDTWLDVVSRRPNTTSRGSPNFFVNSSTNGFFSGRKCGTLSSGGRPSNVDTHGGPIGEIGAAESWKLLVMMCGSAR